jgi:uncharacterized membrane protein
MDDLALARALHVFAVVIWIGGASMATTVFLPALRQGVFGKDMLGTFEAVEHRFIWQARAMVLLVGVTGFYMLWKFDLWDRFHSASFWWMYAMVGVWALFAFVLFIAEPFILQPRFHRWAHAYPDLVFLWVQRVHWVLVGLAWITVFGAVAGSHGWSIF